MEPSSTPAVGLAPAAILENEKHVYAPDAPLESKESVNATGLPPSGTTLEDGAGDSPTDEAYPEGGRAAWLVVLGGFWGIFAAFGLLNSAGVFQAYISTHQLSHYSQSTVGWIFSVYIFLALFCSLQIGPIFDAHGPKLLIVLGSVLTVLSLMLLGLCKEYYQFFLVFGLLAGIATSLLFTPSIAAIGHFFMLRRGAASGVAMAGGSLGGVIIPLMMPPLFSQVGFAWATRILGFLYIAVCAACALLVRSRLPPKHGASIWPDLTILRQPNFAIFTAGMFFIEFALFIPLNYLTLFALTANTHISSDFAYQLNAILNAGSCIGRLVPGWISDHIGRFNTILMTLSLCFLTNLAFWLPATMLPSTSVAIKPLLIVFSLFFGFASGSNISLIPACVGQLCATQELGRYYATCYTVCSFASLVGIPVGGALLKACGNSYYGMALFTGLLYVGAVTGMATVRVRRVGWNVRAFF